MDIDSDGGGRGGGTKSLSSVEVSVGRAESSTKSGIGIASNSGRLILSVDIIRLIYPNQFVFDITLAPSTR